MFDVLRSMAPENEVLEKMELKEPAKEEANEVMRGFGTTPPAGITIKK